MSERVTVLEASAKEALRKAVRELRAKLVKEIGDAAEGEYQLGVDIGKARLSQAKRCKRERLEQWIGEQLRANGSAAGKGKPKADKATRLEHLNKAVREAAHTLLHRLVLLRILEHHGVVSPAVVTGGWQSPGYDNEFTGYAGPLAQDDTRGYQCLLDTVFAELALELPGVFGPVGLTPLFAVPAATLRDVITVLNDPALASAWGDDTTLGWVYQYWNDPDREALDKKIADGGKIGPTEIAQKTQMFTERYMVEWLLQNSLGLTWLSICKKNGWTPDAAAVLPVLEARRAAFRQQREAGEVALDALMPIAPGLESAWKYYVDQPIPADAIERAPDSIRDLKLLDPACGSGHFLVIAFDLLARMAEEEARHRNETWSPAEIAERILADNLHGIDIDPRAIQIAAAALWLKAKLYAPKAKLARMNLVAPVLRLAHLPDDDPALETLRTELSREVGLSATLTNTLVKSLAGVDYLGTLLRVDDAAKTALQESFGIAPKPRRKSDPPGTSAGEQQSFRVEDAKDTVLEKLETFLAHHSASEDLGVRLDGEQLAAGARFVRMAREGTYDVVVGNPPYQGLSKTAHFEYVAKHYPRGKADLYAAFLERGLELVREGGISALVTMRGWMFLGQFKELRERLLNECDLHALSDLDAGAFDEVSAAQVVLSVVCSVFRRATPDRSSIAIRPTPTEDRASAGMTNRKRAGLLAQVGRYEFDPKGFAVIEGEPIVYWWSKEFLERYAKAPKLGNQSPGRAAQSTGDNLRFVRSPQELAHRAYALAGEAQMPDVLFERWVAFVNGADGLEWFEPLREVVNWHNKGLEIKLLKSAQTNRDAFVLASEKYFFGRGVGFSMIGNRFGARAHRHASVLGNKGSSVYPNDIPNVLGLLNSATGRAVLESLNPGIGFEVGDVNRLPMFQLGGADAILTELKKAFDEDGRGNERSVEYVAPGPSRWRHAQSWAQLAVDRPEGAPLPPYEPEYDPPAPEAHVSFAIGVTLGRFGANGEGILDTPPLDALPAGILFVGPGEGVSDSLDTPPAARILAAWDTHQAAILEGKRSTLRDWLRKDFFAYHKGLYENRPIYFPLSSEKKTFVAWASIHRWNDHTLQTLLADHVNPILRKLDGELADLNVARASSDKAQKREADQRYVVSKRLRDELAAFAETISACAERGAPPADAQSKPRAADAPFVMDLDDGVLINSAALWPLLAPQWADPKKWWKQLCAAEGKKDYDWSHLARRYFPDRVEEKCKTDPSLAVAHACFWKYHPQKAYAWELRLQEEIRPGFTIDEAESELHRARFLEGHAEDAAAIRAKEETRRERARAKAGADDEGEGTAPDAAADPDELEEA